MTELKKQMTDELSRHTDEDGTVIIKNDTTGEVVATCNNEELADWIMIQSENAIAAMIYQENGTVRQLREIWKAVCDALKMDPLVTLWEEVAWEIERLKMSPKEYRQHAELGVSKKVLEDRDRWAGLQHKRILNPKKAITVSDELESAVIAAIEEATTKAKSVASSDAPEIAQLESLKRLKEELSQ